MKKINLLWITGLFASLGVHAAPNINAPDVVRNVFQALIDIFDLVLHGGNNNQVLLTQLLFFVLILAIVVIAVGRIPLFANRNNSATIVAVVVSLLATRFIHLADAKYGESILEFLLLPYGALGIAITTLLPIIIYMFFIRDLDAIIRKIGWVMLAVTFFTFWWIRSDNLGDLSWIYFWAAILSVALLFFDGTMQRVMGRAARERAYHGTLAVQLASLEQQRDEIAELLANNNNPQRRATLRRQLEDIRTRIRSLENNNP